MIAYPGIDLKYIVKPIIVQPCSIYINMHFT